MRDEDGRDTGHGGADGGPADPVPRNGADRCAAAPATWLRAAAYRGEGAGPEKPRLVLGIVPLTDCAPLVVAREKGFFRAHGLEVTLSQEPSWANIRDKVAVGLLDGAQMLAPMPLAASLGIGALDTPMCTACTLDLNGNAITVSNALHARLCAADPEAMAQRPVSARALRRVIEADRRAGRARLTFAQVFPTSTHNYQLRYWLASAGIDPDRDVRLTVVPPPRMVAHLEAGHIDGYCVGEPWNAHAVQAGLGQVLITSYELWNNNPEKVFGVTRAWAERHPETHRAVVMALLEANAWLDRPENRLEAARLIAVPHYVDAPPESVSQSLTGAFRYAPRGPVAALADFNVFFRYAATYPWRSHALWFLSQMIRWGQLERPVNLEAVAREVYRADLYREAAAALGIAYPTVDAKPEGVHAGAWTLHEATAPIAMGADRFFDGRVFDPRRPLEYLGQFEVHHARLSAAALAGAND